MAQLPTGVIAHITVDNAAAAIEFYKKALGGTEVSRALAPDGKRLMHAEIKVNGSSLYLHDDFPEMAGGKSGTPKAFGGSPISLHLNVPNCDEAFHRAVEQGGKPKMPPADQFWGARYALIEDPFGHVWAFMTPLMK